MTQRTIDRIKPVVLLFICALISAPAAADSIRGFVVIQSSKVFIRPVSQGTWLTGAPIPITTELALRTSLLGLDSGDFVVVSGHLNDLDGNGVPDSVEVHAIESVGLNSVIGAWRSPRWEVVRFEDFTRMSLYRPEARASNPASFDLTKIKDLNYTLAPEAGSVYSIFLVEKKLSGGPAPVYVGRLNLENQTPAPISERTLRLEIFDPKTGQSSEVLSLVPISD